MGVKLCDLFIVKMKSVNVKYQKEVQLYCYSHTFLGAGVLSLVPKMHLRSTGKIVGDGLVMFL